MADGVDTGRGDDYSNHSTGDDYDDADEVEMVLMQLPVVPDQKTLNLHSTLISVMSVKDCKRLD